jgi:hypothetical protein
VFEAQPALPGADLVERGLADLEQMAETPEALSLTRD